MIDFYLRNYLLTSELIYAFFLTFLIGIIVLKGVLGIKYSYIVSLLKAMVPLLYVAFFFNEQWSTSAGDTLKYMVGAANLHDLITGDFTYSEVVINILNMRVWHTITSLWFLTSYTVFGNYYWAPLFLSVVFSFLTIRVFYNLLFFGGFKGKYLQYLVVFYALHPYVLAWTSFVPLREALSGFLLLSFIYLVFGFVCGKFSFSYKPVTFLVIIMILIASVRSYLLVLVFSSLFVFISLYRKQINVNRFFQQRKLIRQKDLFVIYAFLLFVTIYYFLHFGFPFQHVKSLINMPKYFFSLLVGPKPWGLDHKYTFLLVAACFHMVMFPFILLLFGDLWKKSLVFKFVVINLIVALVVYALVGWSIRHRYQYEFVIIMLQFHFLYHFIFVRGKLVDMYRTTCKYLSDFGMKIYAKYKI